MTKINKQLSLSIESNHDILSIGLLNKNKIIKVKSFNSDDHLEDTENMFLSINNFFKTTQLNVDDIKSLYVGCGPGSFTNIRKALSLAIGLKVSVLSLSDKKELFITGINSLSAIAYQYFLNTNFSNKKLVLSTIDSKCGDYFIQLYSHQKNSTKSIIALSPILCMIPERFKYFLRNYTSDISNVIILGSHNSKLNKSKLDLKYCNLPSAHCIANIGLEIERQEKENEKFVIDKNLYNLDFVPIYAKNPNIVKK